MLPVIPISCSGARRASTVTKSQGCSLHSFFFRPTERCYQKPLVSVCESIYLCFTSFLPQDVYKVLIDSLLGNGSPSVPTGAFCGTVNISTQAYRDHFSGHVDLSRFIRRETGARIGAPFELVVFQSLASREEISNSGARGERKPPVCVLWKCWCDICR